MSVSNPSEALRVGFCTIIGLPNVGKSTLLNAILGVNLVAVSAKAQTTRNRILGIKNRPDSQTIFVDTPGVQRGAGALRRAMRNSALAAAGDCDVAVHVIDVSDLAQSQPERLRGARAEALKEALSAIEVPLVLALNKLDKLKSKNHLLPILEAYGREHRHAELVPISSRTGEGVDRLEEVIAGHLPFGPRLFPPDMITDRAERFLAAELVREQLFRQLGEELPYACAVRVESFDDKSKSGEIVIDAIVYVERDSQKGIVVGKGGSQIKRLGERARLSLTRLFGCPVHLRLLAKVSANWSRDAGGVREMGHDDGESGS